MTTYFTIDRASHDGPYFFALKMTKVISELTYKIVAYTEIQEDDTNESINLGN